MTSHADAFVAHLESLRGRDRAALAALRHSLTFPPGTDPRTYPHVERFAGTSRHERDPYRLALYAVAALYAMHPRHDPARSLATALGELYLKKKSDSLEGRFIALLGADAENITEYLRQSISLLGSADIGLNYAGLLSDLSRWMSPSFDAGSLRQRWARDFYRVAQVPTHETADSD